MARFTILPMIVVMFAMIFNLVVATGPTESGKATVYTQDGATGSCGAANPDSAMVVALSETYMFNEPHSPNCGRQIQVTNTGSVDGVGGAGNVVFATVVDTCTGCAAQDIDLSVGAWNKATNSAPFGNFEAKWFFTD